MSSAVDDHASYKVDNTAPTVTSVAITAATGVQNAFVNVNDVVTATVTMSEAVNVLTTSGTPQLALNIGGSTKQASYASGTGTSSLTFTYTIAAGDSDSNGISIDANALSLGSGTISDLAGNAIAMTSGAIVSSAVDDNASFKVDTTAPTVHYHGDCFKCHRQHANLQCQPESLRRGRCGDGDRDDE